MPEWRRTDLAWALWAALFVVWVAVIVGCIWLALVAMQRTPV